MKTERELMGLLSSGEVHIWSLDLLRLKRDETKNLLSTLSLDEQKKSRLFSFDRDRLSYGVSHGFLRLILSSYADVSPLSWRFDGTATERPIIPPEFDDFGLYFSMSHSARFVGCAVSKGRECGFDIESSFRWRFESSEPVDFLTEREGAIMDLIPDGLKRQFLNQVWCAKEAYLKAKGVGLATDPATIPLDLDLGPDMSIAKVNVRLEQGWSFNLANLNAGYHMATAARNDGPEPLRFRNMSFKFERIPESTE